MSIENPSTDQPQEENADIATTVGSESQPEDTAEVKEQSPEALREERRTAIIRELENEWEKINGPIERPLSQKEIEKNKKMDEIWGRAWDGRTTQLTDAGNEFYFDHKGAGKNSVPSRAERMLLDRFPEYAIKPEEKQEMQVPNIAEERAAGLESDPRVASIRTELIKVWEQSTGKDIMSAEGQDFLFGDPTAQKPGEQPTTIEQRAQRIFAERHPEDAQAYAAKERTRAYVNPTDDPAIKKTEEVITRLTNRDVEQIQSGMWGEAKAHEANSTRYGMVWSRNEDRIQMREWDSFVAEHPEKAQAYRTKYAAIQQAIERREQREVDRGSRQYAHEHQSNDERAQADTMKKALLHALEELSDSTIAPNDHQQDEIVSVMEQGNLDLLDQPPANVSEFERESFDEKVRAGSITEDSLDDDLIHSINAPFSGPDGARALYEHLQQDQHVLRDIGDLVRESFYENGVYREGWRPTPEDIGRFVERYPTPHTFDKTFMSDRRRELRVAIEQTLSPGLLRGYEMELVWQAQRENEIFPRVRAALYGKRNEYWDQSKLLLQQAREDMVRDAADEDVPVQQPATVPLHNIEERPTPSPQERPLQKETAESMRSRIVMEDLAYQDAGLSEEAKRRSLEWSTGSESAQKYAESIVQLSQRVNLERIRQTARELVHTMSAEAARLGVPLSPYGMSNTWAMWDIGKQYYFFTHPTENDPSYDIGDPMTSKTKREEIINRHLGWEAYGSFHGSAAAEWRRRIMNDEKFAQARAILNTPPKQNGTLSSKKLAELGKALREAK